MWRTSMVTKMQHRNESTIKTIKQTRWSNQPCSWCAAAKRIWSSLRCLQVLERAGRAPSSNKWGLSMEEDTQTRTRGTTPNWSSRTSTCPCRRWSEPWRRSVYPSLTPRTRYREAHVSFANRVNLLFYSGTSVSLFVTFIFIPFVVSLSTFALTLHIMKPPLTILPKKSRSNQLPFSLRQNQEAAAAKKMPRKKTKKKYRKGLWD